jgi:hypothetical protein
MEDISLVIAVVMIKIMPGQERSIYGTLKESDGIKSIHHAFGEYDFFVVIQAPGIPSMEKIVDEIRDAHGVAIIRAIVSSQMNLKPFDCDILDTGEIGPDSALCC